MSLGIGSADGNYTRFEIVNGVLQVVEDATSCAASRSWSATAIPEIITGNEQDNGLASGTAATIRSPAVAATIPSTAAPDNDTYDYLTGGGPSLGSDTLSSMRAAPATTCSSTASTIFFRVQRDHDGTRSRCSSWSS